MSISPCCLQGFEWEGTPTGRVEKLASLNTYVAGTNPAVAILIIHDLLGWTFPNIRLLADHYAKEINATVYIPDFLGGEVLPFEPLVAGRWDEVDIAGCLQRNSRDIREPEIFEFARTLRAWGYEKVGAVGFCYGGWAAFRLGAKEHAKENGEGGGGNGIVNCISVGHPSLLKKEDIDGLGVPVQVLAPERDVVFTKELKMHTFETVMRLGLPLDYHHFPRVEHGSLVRGDEKHDGEREAMLRAKNAVVGWMKEWLHVS